MTSTDDQMAEIKAQVEARYKAFDAKRQKLIKAHENAKTTEESLRTLAAIIRQQHAYMYASILNRGWMTDSLLTFADRIEQIAEAI